MKEKTRKIGIQLLEENNLSYLQDAFLTIVEKSISAVARGAKILVCGNGGSAADSQHIVGELQKGFVLPRKLSEKDQAAFDSFGKDGKQIAKKLQYGIPAVALTGSEAISTAVINDNGAEMMFAQQAYALVEAGDIFIGISTSGNAENVCLAAITAKAKGAYTIGLCGKDGGKLAKLSDNSLVVALCDTFRIQEKHLPLYHAYCLCLEEEFFGE
ncbi:MAG: SIS domain-containing protein [Clostridia bacterium]|nr:SIS domain-containing protein [Clostridia bacterium]